MDRPLRVLIVEDSDDDTFLLLRMLRQAGYDVQHERVESAELLDAVLPVSQWDIVISDYSMPRFDGLSALRRVQSYDRDLPFILISGTIGEERAVEALKAGAHDFIVKGNWARLAPAIERELGEAEHRRARQRAERELRESENLRRTIVDSDPECIKLIAAAGTVVYINPAGLGMIEADLPEQVIGRSVYPLIAEEDRERYRETNERIFRGDSAIAEFTMVGVRGARRRMESHSVPLRNEHGQIFAALSITRDVTQQRKSEAELRRRAEEMEALYENTRSLSATLDLPVLLPALIERATTLLNVPHGTIFLHDRVRGDLEMVANSRGVNRASTRMAIGHGSVGRAALTRQTLLDNDYTHSELRVETEQHPEFVAVLSAPMLYSGELIGVLSLAQSDPAGKRFSEAEGQLLELFASQAASAVHNARLFAETDLRLRHMQALREIDQAIASSMDLRMTLDLLLDQVVSQLQVDAADVLLLNLYTQTLEFSVGRGFRTDALKHTRLRLGDGLAGRAALERRIVEMHGLSESNGLRRSTQLPRENFVDYYAVPLIAKGQVKGVLEVFHRRPHEHSVEWLDFLEALGGQAAIAIDNATLFDGLQRSNLELMLAYDTTLEGWSRALDLRDKETEGHTQRVAEMTVTLARAMGLSEAELVHVRRGALLHDMGKMGVPDHILLKPGPLNDDEWNVMRKHPQYAYDMLAPIAFLGPALDIPYAHHEKWDGTGYPRRLRGEQIPLAARIFAVVDVWDALRSDRPYRSGWPHEKVQEHIRAISGSHFDPNVVEVFLQLDEFKHAP